MARRFQFRLAAVLKVRRHRLDEARRVVADRQRHIARIREQIHACQDGIVGALGQSREVQSASTPDIVTLRRCRSYVGAMEQAIAAAQVRMAREEEQLRQEQGRLAQANKEVKIIEKLRERQWSRHQEEHQREERIENDEISLQLHRRVHQTVL